MTSRSDETMELITSDNEYYARLIVPTQSDGATFSTKGWNVGGDTISRTTSKGSIEEEPYEDYVSRLFIHSDHIEIGVMLGTDGLKQNRSKGGNLSQPERTIRLDISEITDVRKGKIGDMTGRPALVFETAEDVYKFKIVKTGASKGLLKKILPDKVQEQEPINSAVQTLRQRID